MKIEKLPSGSYRVRKMVNGKTYSLTFDHRPTQKEIQDIIIKKTTGSDNGKMRFEYACREYIADRDNTLAPDSVLEYNNKIKKMSQRLLNMYVDDISNKDIQKEVNRFAATHAPSTTKNYYGFIRSVLGVYREDLRLKVTLTMEADKPPYIPHTEDINTLLKHIEGTQLELCVRLGALGLRRAEICALTLSDLEGNYLTISKDKVRNKDGKWIIKPTPKTAKSYRTIYVSDRIVELANTVGFYPFTPDYLYRQLIAAEKACGVPHFSIHKLRHYFASTALDSLPEADVQKFGGWATDGAMKRIYRHVLDDKTKLVANSIFDKLD